MKVVNIEKSLLYKTE